MIWSYFYNGLTPSGENRSLSFAKFSYSFYSQFKDCTLEEALLLIRNTAVQNSGLEERLYKDWPATRKALLLLDGSMKIRGGYTTSEHLQNFLSSICSVYQRDPDFYLLVSSIDEIPLVNYRSISRQPVLFVGLQPLEKHPIENLLESLIRERPEPSSRRACALCAAMSGGHPRYL